MRLMLKLLFFLPLLVILLVSFVAWKSRSGQECFVFADSYVEIAQLNIDGRKHYLYSMVSGFQDKSRGVAISNDVIPEIMCDYSSTGRRINLTDIEEGQAIKKLVIRRVAPSDFRLDVIYGGPARASQFPGMSGVIIEIDGKPIHRISQQPG